MSEQAGTGQAGTGQAGTGSGRSLAGYPGTSRRPAGPGERGDDRGARTGLRPGAPPAVRAAVRLMYAGAVLDAAAVVTIALTRATARAAVLAAHPAAWHMADLRLTEDMIAAPVLILAWLWLSRAIGGGRDWGRFAFIAFFALSSAGLLAAVVGAAWHYAGADFAVGAALWLVQLAVLALVFSPPSGSYFEQAAGRR
jgi:hypothetical protein